MELANLASLTSRQQAMFQWTQEMMAAMNTRFDHMTSNWNNDRGESLHRINEVESWFGQTNHGSTGFGGTLIPQVTKLDFPLFNDKDDPTGWICRSEQFFEFQNIPNEEWISLTAYHPKVTKLDFPRSNDKDDPTDWIF